jgi:hypothetical protein
MQARAMALMGRKLSAAQALEGSFSGEGLAALAGEDANVELALARSLVERMDEGDARRDWGRVLNPRPLPAPPPDPARPQHELWLAGLGPTQELTALSLPHRLAGQVASESSHEPARQTGAGAGWLF